MSAISDSVAISARSVGGHPLQINDQGGIADLSNTMTAGFKIADGTAVWHDAGTRFVCTELPCSALNDPNAVTFGVRVRGTGRERFTRSTGKIEFSHDADTVLEGFELRGGRTTWTVDLGANPLTLQTIPPRLAAAVVVLHEKTGVRQTIDLSNGRIGSVPAHAVLWCSAEVNYKDSAPQVAVASNADDSHVGANALFPCNSAGKRLATPASVPRFVGPAVGKIVVWSDVASVNAAPAAP